MAKRRRHRRHADTETAAADDTVVEFVPFADGQPIRVADLNIDVDDTSLQERVDGPSATPSSSGGSARDINDPAEGKSNLQKLEQFVTSDEVWRIVEPVMDAHREFVASRNGGCEPEYTIMDIMVFEAASWVYKTFLRAHNNLYKDLKNWQRLVEAVEEAYPDNPNRRLWATPPSRYQHIRARKNFLNGEQIDAARDTYQTVAVDTALDMGMFDPKSGTFSRPDKRQFLTGDQTRVPARYKRHRSNAFDPRTGKVRRHDPDADYYHDNQGKRSGSPGRGLVLLSGRNPYANERIIFDDRFMPRKGDPAIAGRNDADICADMFIDLLDKFPVLDARVHGLVYDGAADSELVDRLHNRAKHAVVPPRKTSKGNYAAANLGAYNFTTTTSAVSRHTVTAIAGSAVVVFVDGSGDEYYVPLVCTHRKPVARKDGYTICGRFEMPDHELVPEPLLGAQALIPFNSTQAEIDAKPHRRRTRAFRTIPESDPRCARIRGLRPDVESLNSHIKDLLPYKPARLRTSDDDSSRLNALTYRMLQLTAAKTAYNERTQVNTIRPPPRPPPRAWLSSAQQLPTGDEPVLIDA